MTLIEKRIENFTLLKNEEEKITKAANLIKEAISNNSKILICGNGGSACDSNHIACEFVSKFQKERSALPAISLCSNNSIITAVANDYSFEEVFKRQIEALGNKNDILIAISTSAKSKNVLLALDQAKKQGLKTILLTGLNKTNLDADIEINAPSQVTAHVQEMHIAVLHMICEILDI